MFKYPKSANSLGEIKDVAAAAAAAAAQAWGAGEFQVQHFMYFMEN